MLTNNKESKMNIALNDKEYRIVCAALSYLSANVDDAFDDESIHEDEVIELRERLSSSAGLEQV